MRTGGGVAVDASDGDGGGDVRIGRRRWVRADGGDEGGGDEGVRTTGVEVRRAVARGEEIRRARNGARANRRESVR